MLKSLSWSDSFAIGIDIIDEQHKRLFDYFDEIEHCIKKNDDTNIIEICRGLIDYAISHNTFEESLMKQAGYPMLDAHHQVHEAFKARAHSYLDQINNGAEPMKIARDVRTDIGLWLINHIKREDKHYAPYVKKTLNKGFVSKMLGRFFN
ncbi:MAG TPA: bacteriohemerythrin [Gammaproteobacteria bacterium]|nr:bacteriohemerythrin [Gammaproteobacteria bacterium]